MGGGDEGHGRSSRGRRGVCHAVGHGVPWTKLSARFGAAGRIVIR